MLFKALSVLLLSAATIVTCSAAETGHGLSAPFHTRDGLAQNTHECSGYCSGPTCGDTCSCRMNLCYKGPHVGNNLYRIYNQPVGQAIVDGKVVALSNGDENGADVQWKLESVSGATYHIVSKLSGTAIGYDSQHPESPLIITTKKTFPVVLIEWDITPVAGSRGLFNVKLINESGGDDLYWTANGSTIQLQLQANDGSDTQGWRIRPFP
ncbi:hypothetical protein C8R46DRAFT_1197724 [Mycena filopes]|nr:hypothetical protein C8R46DRAFT_1197724 [Mycena filopes]